MNETTRAEAAEAEAQPQPHTQAEAQPHTQAEVLPHTQAEVQVQARDAGVGGRRDTALKVAGVCGAVIGYGSLAAFAYLISLQIYRWFRQGEWTHFGVSEGIRVGLLRCCVNDTDTGRLASLVHWLDAPVDWLGLHKVLEVLPASLALFLVSMLGNSIYIYCRDRIGEAPGA